MSEKARQKWRRVSELSRRLSSREALRKLLSLTTDSTPDPDYEPQMYSGDPWQGHSGSGDSGTVGQYATRVLARANHRAVPALLHLARSNHLAASHLARVVQSAVNKVQPVELRAAAALVGRDVNEDALWLAYADLRDGERSSATFARTLRAMEHLPEPRAAEFVSHIAALPGCAPLLAMAAGSPNLTAKVRSRVFVALEFDRRLLSEVVIDALTGAVREDDDPDLVDSALKCFRARKIRWRHDPREHARRLIEADPAMLGRAGAADALESLASQVAEAVDNVARDDLVMALCVDTEPLRRRLVLRAIHRVPPLPDAHIELLVTAYRRRLQDPAQRKDAGIDVFHFRQLAAAMSRTKEPHED